MYEPGKEKPVDEEKEIEGKSPSKSKTSKRSETK